VVSQNGNFGTPAVISNFQGVTGSPAASSLAAARNSVGGANDRNEQRFSGRERHNDLEAELQRVQRDLDHQKQRTDRENAELRRFQHAHLAFELLPVLDRLEHAIGCAQGNPDDGASAEAITLIHAMLLKTLERHGVVRMMAKGESFDPFLHHAAMRKPNLGLPANKIVQVLKEGYTIHDRLLRPAKVVVAID